MANKLTDEQRQMVADNHNLIYSFLNKYHLPDFDWYDTAAFGLIKAAMTYDNSTAFSTYAYKCMFNEMRNEFVRRDRHEKEDLSLDYEYSNDKGESFSMADMIVSGRDFTEDVIANHDALHLINFLESRLRTDSQREQFKLLCQNVPIAEIASKCGVSKQQVYLVRKNLLTEYNQIFAKDGTIKPAVVGGKLRIANNPYLYNVMARNNRYIICTRKYNGHKNIAHTIIDLRENVYGDDGGPAGRYDTAEMCQTRLKELQNGTISIATTKKINFYVA